MASSGSTPDGAGPHTRQIRTGKKSTTSKDRDGLGIFIDPSASNSPDASSTRTSPDYNPTRNTSVYQSPDVPSGHWTVSGRIKPVPQPSEEQLTESLQSTYRYLSNSMALFNVPIPADSVIPPGPVSAEQQTLPYRPAHPTSKPQAEQTHQDSNLTVAQLQKEASTKHNQTITALLTKYLPPVLLQPHPSAPKNQANAPSILDLEVRHATSNVKLTTYQNHIASKPDRESFRRSVRESEIECFGPESRVAVAMHEEAMRLAGEEEREKMEAKWMEKVRRRGERDV